MHRRLLLLAGLAALLAGCPDQKQLFSRLIPETEDRFARRFLEAIRTDDLPAAVAMLDGSIEGTAARRGLEELRRLFTQSALTEIETIGFQVNWNQALGQPRRRIARLDYQLSLTGHWLAGSVLLVGEADALKVNTARFNPLPAPLGVLNAFTFDGKGPVHFLALGGVIIVPAFCVVALVLCIRSRVRRKWLWIIFILLPLGTLRLNWTTGAWETQLLSFNVLGAGFIRSGLYAPWVLSVGFPVGAAVFLLRRRALLLPPGPPPIPQ